MQSPTWNTSSPFLPGKNRIVVIDDDNGVAEITKRVLAVGGWDVVRAVNGADGVALLVDSADSVAVVIVDAGLPDVECHALCARIQELAPAASLLLTSGLHGQRVRDPSDRTKHLPFLPKPFTPSELHRRIGALVQQSNS